MKNSAHKSALTRDKKILHYSAMAAGFLGISGEALADVIFTDVDPDQVIASGTFNIDFDGDGTTEFTISQYAFSSSYASYYFSFVTSFAAANIFGSAPGAAILNQPGAGGNLVKPLTSGSVVASSAAFSPSYAVFGRRSYFHFVSASYSSTFGSSTGLWSGLSDQYAGVRFSIGGMSHYGWIRCDVATDYNSITIKSFAYENVPGAPIVTGDTIGVAAVYADSVTSLFASDVTDFTNGLDLQVDFTKAADESTIGEYRLMVVKASSAPSFGLSTALLVPSISYRLVNPSGSDVSVNMGASGRDTDGAWIIEGVAYRVFVLSLADGTVANINNLTGPSNEVTLSTFSAPAGTASNLIASDNGNLGDGRDILVNFSPALDESTVADYRILIAKESVASTIDADFAASLSGERIKSVFPIGGPITTTMRMTSEDTDGDLIVEDVSYVAFVVSMPDGVNATYPTLTAGSAPFMLRNTTGLADLLGTQAQLSAVDQKIRLTQTGTERVEIKIFKTNGQLLAQETFDGSGEISSQNWSAGEIVLVQLQLVNKSGSQADPSQHTAVERLLIR